MIIRRKNTYPASIGYALKSEYTYYKRGYPFGAAKCVFLAEELNHESVWNTICSK